MADNSASLDLYDAVIAPYKGEVEAWYVEHQTLLAYFAVILVTILVILFPSSGIVWRVFKGLPTPPVELKKFLNYPV